MHSLLHAASSYPHGPRAPKAISVAQHKPWLLPPQSSLRTTWFVFLGRLFCFLGDGKNTHRVCPEFLRLHRPYLEFLFLSEKGTLHVSRKERTHGLHGYFAILRAP
jgi:hypothetical protein